MLVTLLANWFLMFRITSYAIPLWVIKLFLFISCMLVFLSILIYWIWNRCNVWLAWLKRCSKYNYFLVCNLCSACLAMFLLCNVLPFILPQRAFKARPSLHLQGGGGHQCPHSCCPRSQRSVSLQEKIVVLAVRYYFQWLQCEWFHSWVLMIWLPASLLCQGPQLYWIKNWRITFWYHAVLLYYVIWLITFSCNLIICAVWELARIPALGCIGVLRSQVVLKRQED